MILFSVNRTYVLYDELTGRREDRKNMVGHAIFTDPAEARDFLSRSEWETEADLNNPHITWQTSHAGMLEEGWELGRNEDLLKEPTDAIDLGLLDKNEDVPVILRRSKDPSLQGVVMAVLPTLPPNPWLYGESPSPTVIPKILIIAGDMASFEAPSTLRDTVPSDFDNSFSPVLPLAAALVARVGLKLKQVKTATEAHRIKRRETYLNVEELSVNRSADRTGETFTKGINRYIDLS